jgi:catechol 2,3-dioxygenase-like lactoylglutathione lyase family enzyme
MKKLIIASITSAFAMLCITAHADSLLAARVEGYDVAALAKFYQQSFGLQEVNRFASADNKPFEIMLNFGDTVDAAKANKATQIVITQQKEKEVIDAIPHIVITVADITKVVAAFKAAGGKFEHEPETHSYNKGTFIVVVGTDPAGNKVEVISFPDRK